MRVTDNNTPPHSGSRLRLILSIGLIAVVIVSMFLGVAFFLPWLLMGKENAISLASAFLVMLGIGIVVAIPKLLIDTALQRKGKLLGAIESLNSACMLIVILAGVYFVIVGAEDLWKESPMAFAVVAGATAFAVYFHIQKHEANKTSNHPPHGQ